MTKLILAFIFFNAFAIKAECQRDNLPVDQQLFDLNKKADSLQVQFNQLKNDKKRFDFLSVVPWILTGITIFVSAMVYKREVSYRNVSFVTESNKMKIADPTIWAFYDTYKQDYNVDILINQYTFQIKGIEDFDVKSNGTLTARGSGNFLLNGILLTPDNYRNVVVKQNDKIKVDGNFVLSITNGASISFKGVESKKLEGKIRAYSYFKLNSFELVFNYNQITGSSNTVWEDYMINSMIDSTSFYNISKRESTGYLYNKDYREKPKDFLVIADLCKMKKADEINRIIESKGRLILAFRSGLVSLPSEFSKILKYLN